MAYKIYLSPSNQLNNAYEYGNTTEMIQCNRIAAAAETALKRCGFDVKRAVQGQDMFKSIAESNSYGADVHVCIHTNAGGGKGTEVFVYDTSNANMKYAKAVYNELVKINASKVARYIGKYRYGGTLAEIENTSAVAVYCECEFHDNAEYAKYIIENVTKFGEAIAKGLCSAFKVKYIAATSDVKTLDKSGYKFGDATIGCLAMKQLLTIAKNKKIITQGVDCNDNSFGSGTKKAVNQVLKLMGYQQNGIAGKNFIKKITALINK